MRRLKELRYIKLFFIMSASISVALLLSSCSKDIDTKNSSSTDIITENSTRTASAENETEESTISGDINADNSEHVIEYTGTITNKDIKPVTIQGEAVYDKNCVNLEDKSMECDGGIYTREYGLLNFHYRHFMSEEDCIAPKSMVTIIISENNAAVVRLQVKN